MEKDMHDRSEFLVMDARLGSGEAFETLVSLYGPLIQKHIGKYSGRFSYDELYAEACEALLDAVSHWRRDGGAHFSRYAEACVSNRLKSFYKAHTEAYAAPLEDDVTDEDMECDVLRRDDAVRLLHEVRKVASAFEFRVFSYYWQGYTPREIADRLGRSEKDITNAKARLYAKLRREADRFVEFL